jgi:hypothetical protein
MLFARYLRDEGGAVTIDWVALAAGLLLLTVPLVSLISDEVQFVMTNIETEYLTADDITPPSGS